MGRVIGSSLLLAAVLTASSASAQAPGPPPAAPDAKYYAVSYIEVAPASRAAAVTSLKSYRDAAGKAMGTVELFEQANRPAHFVLVETWATKAAFDASAAGKKQLASAVQASRLSDWDTRPYQTLSVSPAKAKPGAQTLFVISHVDVVPNPKVAPMLKVLAEASRKEEGNARFDVLAHRQEENHFEVIEAWQSQSAVDAHAAAAHTRKYRDDLAPTLGSPLDERIYKAIE